MTHQLRVICYAIMHYSSDGIAKHSMLHSPAITKQEMQAADGKMKCACENNLLAVYRAVKDGRVTMQHIVHNVAA